MHEAEKQKQFDTSEGKRGKLAAAEARAVIDHP